MFNYSGLILLMLGIETGIDEISSLLAKLEWTTSANALLLLFPEVKG